jgi:hypothetical protein
LLKLTRSLQKKSELPTVNAESMWLSTKKTLTLNKFVKKLSATCDIEAPDNKPIFESNREIRNISNKFVKSVANIKVNKVPTTRMVHEAYLPILYSVHVFSLRVGS